MKLLQRTGILFFALLILFGSGGWVLTDHFCRVDTNSCVSAPDKSCCCGSEEDLPQVPSTGLSFSGPMQDCCVNSSSYFTMPVYRIEVNRDFQPKIFFETVHFAQQQVALTTDPTYFSVPVKPPPENTRGIDFLVKTGTLLI